MDIEILAVVAGCIGGRFLANLFLVLASNYRHWGGGMPDLLLWRINNREKTVWDAKDLKGMDMLDEEFRLENIMQKHEPNIGKIPAQKAQVHVRPLDTRKFWIVLMTHSNSDDPVKCDILFIEVKGPRDRLDGRQTAWLKKLIDFGIPAGVCRIQEPKKVSTKLKSRADVQVLSDDSNTKASGPTDRAVLSQKMMLMTLKENEMGETKVILEKVEKN